jgi:hypothetical protein
VFRLNRNKQKSNQNSVIEGIFWYFFHKIWGFSVCFVFFCLFRNSLFLLFRFYTETESFDVSIEPKQTEDQPKQFDRENILGIFQKKFCFLCHETNPKQILFRFVSVSNRNFFFVCF